MNRIALIIGIWVGLGANAFAQELHLNKDEKYIPKNLPELILSKKEANTPVDKKASGTYPDMKISISTDPFFLLYMLGPYLRLDYSLKKVTLFAGFAYSKSNASILGVDAVGFFIPVNYVVLAQDETYISDMIEGIIINNKNSFAFEGGIIFGRMGKLVSDGAWSVFLRYAQGGGYEETNYQKWNGIDYETIVKITQYDVQLLEIAAVYRSPWGRLHLGGARFYMTTDWGLGMGILNVKTTKDKQTSTNVSFVLDVILRLYMGIAF